MAIELATAYVSIQAETTKLEAGIKQAFTGVGRQAETAGKDAGTRLARTASKAMRDGWRPDQDIMAGIPDTKLDRIGARIGQVIGKGVAGGLKARQAGVDFGRGFQDGASSVGLGKLVSGWKNSLSGASLASVGATAGRTLMMGVTGAAAVGAAGIAGVIGTAVTGGFNRLLTIDKSKQKLKALGKSTKEVADIVKIVTESVTGTPFSLDSAFGTAVQAIGAGTDDIGRFMKDVVDAAGFAGVEIDRMGLIFNQVLAKGKLTGEEMMQLMEAGLPAKSWIADSYKLTSDQFEKMQKDGEITMDMLQKSIEDHAPGMGKALGDTLSGSIDGMKTAVARLGADFLAAIFGGDASEATDTMADSIQKITDKLNGVDSWVKQNGPGIQSTFQKIGGAIQAAFKAGQDAIKSFMDDIKLMATALGKIVGAMAKVSEFMDKIPGVGGNGDEARTLRQWEQNLLNFGNPNPAGQQGGGPNQSRMQRGLAPVTSGGAAGSILNNMATGGGLPNSVGAGGSLALQSGNWQDLDALANAKFGLTMTSGYRDASGATIAGVPAAQSFHSTGQAHDFAGTPDQMLAFANYMATTYGSQLKELIYDHPSFGSTIKDGSVVGPFGAYYTMDQAGNHADHVHVAFADGGGVRGAGTAKSDSIPALLSNGEHVLTADDVQRMGGQAGVYAFRSALHRAGGGEIFKLANVSDDNYKWGKGGPGNYGKPSDKPTDLPPIFGESGPGFVHGSDAMPRGPKFDPKWFFPWWWSFAGGNKLDPLTPNGKIRKNLPMFADGGAVLTDEQKKALEGQHGATMGTAPGPNDVPHGMTNGAAPGPTQPTQGGDGLDFVRSMGFIPAAASSSGVSGTSSLAGFINMGNDVVSGIIDTGTNLAQQAASAAIMAGAAGGGMGAGAAAAPLADMAASYGIQLAGKQAKRISQWGFQMLGIGADALVEQMSPFGVPRALGYDYTNFAPQLGIEQALTSTVEKMGSDAISKQFPQPGVEGDGSDPAGPAAPFAPIPAPPAAVPAAQWDAMATTAEPPPAAPLVGNLYATDVDGAFRQLDKTQRRNMMQYSGRP